MNNGKFRLEAVPGVGEIGEAAPIETDAATAPPEAPASDYPAVIRAEPPAQQQEAALISISPEIETSQLQPAVQQIVDAIKTGYKKLKTDYWAGVLSGAVIVWVVHYWLKESKED